jgi:hypothetical protein
LFAQIEYGLKQLGFVRAKDRGVEVKWDEFANDCGKIVMQDTEDELASARDYLFKYPPQRQKLSNGSLGWEAVSKSERSSQALFGHIRRIRNNLYHGGKMHNGQWTDPDRTRTLLRNSLLILKALKEKDDQLRDKIEG